MGRKPTSKRLSSKNIANIARKSKNKRGKLHQWSEARMKTAVNEFFSNKNKKGRRSIRKLAQEYDLPLTTLADRLKQTPSENARIKPKLGRKTIFTATQETELVSVLVDLSKRGFGLTPLYVRRLAYQYATTNEIAGLSQRTGIAGYDWLQSFLSRHCELSVRKPENLAIGRAINLNEAIVNSHFKGLWEVMSSNDIVGHPTRIWNCDETGLQDVFESGDIVASKKGRVFNLTGRERGETTTLLSAISADGDTAPHMIILKGKRSRADLQAMMAPGDLLRMSDSGWIKDVLFAEWGHHFIRYLRGRGVLGPKVILILDGHTTHSLNIELINAMNENGVILWCIPPHTSHYLQPLDKNVFCALKRGWNRLGVEKTHSIGGRLLNKVERLSLIYDTIPLAFTCDNIKNGFLRTGLYPFNQLRISSDAFLPSKNTELPVDEVSVSEADGEAGVCRVPGPIPLVPDEPVMDEPAQDEAGDKLPTSPVHTHCSTSSFSDFIAKPENPRKPTTKKRSKSPSQNLTSSAHINWVLEKRVKSSGAGTTKSKAEGKGKSKAGGKGKSKAEGKGKSKAGGKGKSKAEGKGKSSHKGKATRKSKAKKRTESGRSGAKDQHDYCSVCGQYYFDQTSGDEWICCTICESWQHISCANVVGKNLYGYMCVYCSDD